jgi:hypothetical protein
MYVFDASGFVYLNLFLQLRGTPCNPKQPPYPCAGDAVSSSYSDLIQSSTLLYIRRKLIVLDTSLDIFDTSLHKTSGF